VREEGGVVGIHEADVLTLILRIRVVDAGAVELDQDREAGEVLGLREVVEGDLSPFAPGPIPPVAVRVNRGVLARIVKNLSNVDGFR
jgi:hypothetical protein